MLELKRSINSALSSLCSHISSRSIAGNDDLLSYAFRLAYFIYPDEKVACTITATALSQVNSALKSQRKRWYYSAASDHRGKKRIRGKVVMSRPQLLQQLIYSESEPFEIKQEKTLSRALLTMTI